MKRDKNSKLFATGLFISSGIALLNHFIIINDFVNGCLKGVGIGIMIFALYKMKYKPAA